MSTGYELEGRVRQKRRTRDALVAAARELGVPHRTAWQRVREMEARLGVKLVEASSGGAAGGASHLTPEAEDLVRRYAQLRDGLDELVAQRYRAAFDR